MSPERVRRNDDERLYQPLIHSRHIRILHLISEETGKPMTVLIDQALTDFVERYGSVDGEKRQSMPFRRAKVLR
jgi:hypothetical protein